MKLITEITVGAVVKDEEFKNKETGEVIKYSQIHFLDTKTQKLGDNYIEVQLVEKIACSSEVAEQLEIGETYKFEITAKAQAQKGGYPVIKYRAISIVD